MTLDESVANLQRLQKQLVDVCARCRAVQLQTDVLQGERYRAQHAVTEAEAALLHTVRVIGCDDHRMELNPGFGFLRCRSCDTIEVPAPVEML